MLRKYKLGGCGIWTTLGNILLIAGLLLISRHAGEVRRLPDLAFGNLKRTSSHQRAKSDTMKDAERRKYPRNYTVSVIPSQLND